MKWKKFWERCKIKTKAVLGFTLLIVKEHYHKYYSLAFANQY